MDWTENFQNIILVFSINPIIKLYLMIEKKWKEEEEGKTLYLHISFSTQEKIMETLWAFSSQNQDSNWIRFRLEFIF